MASVSIYFFLDNKIIVCPIKRTTAGLGIESAPYIQLEAGAHVSMLGQEIRNALTESKGIVPHPTDWKGLSAPRLAAAGVRSEKAFMAKARLIQVRESDSGYMVSPTINGGASGSERGFSPRTECKVILPKISTAAELGEQVLKSVANCVSAT